MAPRNLDDADALTTGAAQTDPAENSLADDAFPMDRRRGGALQRRR